jgi:glyoxylase-like metal-dependent hydrolase (beta-lactamase superfamily II)
VCSYICQTCGTAYPPSEAPPHGCSICDEERQYVGLSGQKWITPAELEKDHRNTFTRHEERLTAIRTEPSFAINQRAFLLESPAGNILWDCLSLLDEPVSEAILQRGGLSAIAISHPHYYTSMNRWSEVFGEVPVYLHEADRGWVVWPGPNIRYWSGETCPVHDSITLIRCGGHFEGGTVLHWPAGAEGRGVLLSGDIIQVVPDRRWVSFMYSYPNLIPLNTAAVQRIVSAVEPFEFDRVYGAFHPMQVISDGKNAVRRSADRYIRAISVAD